MLYFVDFPFENLKYTSDLKQSSLLSLKRVHLLHVTMQLQLRFSPWPRTGYGKEQNLLGDYWGQNTREEVAKDALLRALLRKF